MVVTKKNFDKLAKMYEALIIQFFALHGIKSFVCTDTNEHYFKRIVAAKNGSIKVFNHGITNITCNNLHFDFTADYAKCLSDMEHIPISAIEKRKTQYVLI